MVSTASRPEARFAFGQNWRRFLETLDENRVLQAENSLQLLLDIKALSGQRFLDIGSGSGLFSLAALRLGAEVQSVDYDAESVACAEELKRRFFNGTARWLIEQGSVLDDAAVASWEPADIVYSWGVLHHTGAMWRAIENAASRVKPGGALVLALYNDQGLRSKLWLGVKQVYNRLPPGLRPAYAALFLIPLWGPTLAKDLLHGRPFHSWRTYASHRGMSAWRDVVDWVGGLPFEVAKPEKVAEFCQARGFEPERLLPEPGLGCNQFVFRRKVGPAPQ
jgi:SAM-dependent methyltransferase